MVSSSEDTPTGDPPAKENDERRTFLVQASAIVIGGIVGFVPLLVGLRNFFNPLLRSKDDDKVDEAVRIATLDDIAEVGKEVYRFKVNAIRIDAWSKHPPGPIGAVYVRRDSNDPKVLPKVYTSVCPHLGCSVDYKEDREQFVCPCHGGIFAKDGSLVDPETAVPPRGLDELEDVEIRNGNELWVVYRRYRSGIEAKIAE